MYLNKEEELEIKFAAFNSINKLTQQGLCTSSKVVTHNGISFKDVACKNDCIRKTFVFIFDPV